MNIRRPCKTWQWHSRQMFLCRQPITRQRCSRSSTVISTGHSWEWQRLEEAAAGLFDLFDGLVSLLVFSPNVFFAWFSVSLTNDLFFLLAFGFRMFNLFVDSERQLHSQIRCTDFEADDSNSRRTMTSSPSSFARQNFRSLEPLHKIFSVISH